MAKRSKIVQPGDPDFVQLGLFSTANLEGQDAKLRDYPQVYRDAEGFKKVLSEVNDLCGLDYEFRPNLTPTVMGISNDQECAAVFYDREIHQLVEDERTRRGFAYSGHAVLTADRQVHEKALGVETPLGAWSDSMLTFWAANSDLCKMPAKEEDGDGGLGFMGLGTMGMLTTDLPLWKNCRGRMCEELICPTHDVRGYCAVDSYVGLVGDRASRKTLKQYNVPTSLISDLHELQEVAAKMQALGMAVDMEYVRGLNDRMAEQQKVLFPAAGQEGYVFNPRSPKEIVEWAKANKVFVGSTDKDSVQTLLEKLATAEGYTGDSFSDVQQLLETNVATLEPVLGVIYRLYQYKILGKGTDSWFADKYFGPDGYLHPRWVVTGTSTGRFSSSRPNCQNIPKRGWGKLVRGAFIPHDPENLLVEADFSQLELRVILYLAGIDPSIIGDDAFSWLVTKSDGKFERAAQRYGGKARDIAKSVSHGANYLEGLRLISPDELQYTRVKSEIDSGALRVYKDWEFCGKVVAFTGSNLAQRLFGDKSYESRKKALEIQEDIYFDSFPIRAWQKAALDKAQDLKYVQSPTGQFMRLNDTVEKNAKLIVAFLGQGVGAAHTKATMIQYRRRHGTVFNATIHDALVKEMPKGNYRGIYNFMKEMEDENPTLPGLRVPSKIEVGERWGSMQGLFMHDGELWVGDEKKPKECRRVG